MTTTPLPPLPNLRGGIVKHTILGELYDRLQVEQRMVAYATQVRADLEAENARLREALHRIDSVAVFLPTFDVLHEGGIEAVTQNIVEAISKAVAALEKQHG